MSTNKYNLTILESILDKAEKELIPLTVLLELTRYCNLNCRHCYRVIDDARDEIPTSRIFDLIDELRQAGCLFLTLTGGEPLTRPDFLEICQRAHSANLVIHIFTNGTLVTEELARQLSRLNILDIALSIYGATANTHDHITRQEGSYRQTLKAASILKNHGLSVRFKYIMMNENITEYGDMLKLAQQLDIHYSLDAVITPCDNGNLNPTKLRLSDKDLKKIYRATIQTPKSELPPEAGLKSRFRVASGNRTPNSFSCSFGRSHCAINAYGDIYPCIQLPVSAGNIQEKPFAEIWHDSPWLQEIREFSTQKIPACRECSLLPYCQQCPGLAYVEEGSLYRPAREACRHARIIQRTLKSATTM